MLILLHVLYAALLYFACNIHNFGESCQKVSLCVFSRGSWQFSQCFNSKSAIDWIEAKLGKTPCKHCITSNYCSQTRAYWKNFKRPRKLLWPAWGLTIDYRKWNGEKPLINTGWSLNSRKCVCQPALETIQVTASTIESESGKNP